MHLLVFSQGDAYVERGRQLIHEGIALRRELGVPLYVAAGNCDLGRKNSNIASILSLTCFRRFNMGTYLVLSQVKAPDNKPNFSSIR